jgi:hypothetical protein
VKKIFSFILSSIILTQSLGFSSEMLFKVSEVIEHAKLHKEAYGDDFVMFITKHYGELAQQHQQEHGQDNEDHEQLPFKHISSFSSSFSIAIPVMSYEMPEPISQDRVVHFFIYNIPETTSFTDQQLRPPRCS